MTAKTITIGNVSTLSGPIPGLFAGAEIGAQAFLAFQNAQGGVFGRNLRLEVGDDQFDSGTNRSVTVGLIPRVFAFVGSFSLYDASATPELERAGVPDVGLSLGEQRKRSPVNFSPAPQGRGGITGPWNLFKQHFPDAVQHVGALYGDIPASKDSYLGIKAAAQSVGFTWVYERAFQATETDFTVDVIRMKNAGVRVVYVGGDVKTNARIARAMAQQRFRPDVFTSYASYDSPYIPLAGSAADGLLNITNYAMYLGEDAAAVPEVARFGQWVHEVRPGFKPDTATVYGWTSARLFIEALKQAGPNPTRAKVLAALRTIDHFDSEGMLPDAGPASKRPATCYLIVTVRGGRFQRWESPPPGFRCNDGGFVART